MLKRHLLFFLLWTGTHLAFAQPRHVDSLWAALTKHPRADTFRVNRLLDLASEGFMALPEHQLDSLLVVTYQLSQRLDYPFGQAAALFLQATVQSYKKGQKQQGLELGKRALPLAEQTHQKDFVMNVLEYLAGVSSVKERIVYRQRALAIAQSIPIDDKPERLFRMQQRIVDDYVDDGNYPLALRWGLSLLAKVEKDTNSIHQYLALTGLATIYTRLKDVDNALIYLKRSQLIARKRKDKAQQGATLSDIASIYQQQGQYDKAIETFNQALSLVMNLREDWVIYIESQLASSYERKGLYQQAFAYAHRALAETKTKKDVYGYFDGYKRTIFRTLSQIHLHTGRPDSAFYFAQQSLQFARKRGDKQSLRDADELLAQVYAAQQDYANAYRHQGAFMALKDSLNNEDVIRQTTATQFSVEMDRQKSQIALLNKDKLLQAEQASRQQLLQKAQADRFTFDLTQQQNQIALLNKDKQLQAEAAGRVKLVRQAESVRFHNQMREQQQEAQRQRLFFFSSLAVLVLLVGLAVVLYQNNRNKQKANAQLQAQRDQITQALTELKATQRQLIQKEKMASLGELTAGIAHEIQNPLNFVNNFSEVSTDLVDELNDDLAQHLPESERVYVTELLDDLTSNLKKITHHGQRASAIVKGMLDHSRSSTSESQSTDLNALVDEYLRLAYHGQRAKDKSFTCSLVTEFDSDMGQLEIMPQQMGRVLLNLFTNAFYAVGEQQKLSDAGYQPTVRVTTRRSKVALEIQVSDNGGGIAADIQQKIFQPFFTTKPTGEGTGLGLSLSYDIVTKGHAGSLLVQSQPGEGSTFIIQLPLAGAGA